MRRKIEDNEGIGEGKGEYEKETEDDEGIGEGKEEYEKENRR
jgi:hypothetical protein